MTAQSQFGTFDTLSDRRAIMSLFVRMGNHLGEHEAMRLRARFLQSLIGHSTSGFDGKPMRVSPCAAVQAYHLFAALAGAFGIDIAVAARKLEDFVRRQR